MAFEVTTDWRTMARTGLLAGVIILYTAMIGMIESFSERSIIYSVLTLGQVLLLAPPLVAGYLASQRTRSSGAVSAVHPLTHGAVAGFFATLPTLALLLVTAIIDIREMFVNVSPALIRILTFDQGVLAGAGMLIGLLVVLGVIGALVELLPGLLRKALLTGVIWVLAVGALSELVVQVLRNLFGNDIIRQLFQSNTLRPTVALMIFAVIVVLSILWITQRARVRQIYGGLGQVSRLTLRWGALGLLGVLLLLLPQIFGTFLSEVLANVGMYVLMGLGLNIAIGLAGLLDLGYVTNFAVGAYVMAVLTSNGPLGLGHLSFWLVLPISLLAAMFTGFFFALPVLRMRGDYLAIATLGFGEIVRLLALSDWLRPYVGGSQGVLMIPSASVGTFVFGTPQRIYYLFLAACLITLFVMLRLNNSRTGRQWMALREDEDVAAAMGIDTTTAKVLAFTLSAATGGVAGAIFASKVGSVFPHSFNLLVSINTLSLIIVGGMGSIPGIVVGALVLIGLPELLREFQDYRLLLYGVLLVVMMLVRPEGFIPSAVRRRELYSETATVPGGTAAAVAAADD